MSPSKLPMLFESWLTGIEFVQFVLDFAWKHRSRGGLIVGIITILSDGLLLIGSESHIDLKK